jgi:hypothetical protein
MATNLFKQAKPAETKAKPKKSEVEINDFQFQTSLSRLAEVNQQIDNLNAEVVELTDIVKKRSTEEFIKIYESSKKYPGSFNIISGTSSLMFVPTDRYIKIDEERYNDLQTTYGEEMVEKTDTYTMDTKLVEKYGQIISDLIINCSDIEEIDKANLISVATNYSVKKGTISTILEKFKEHSLETVFEDIRPVITLKNIK